MDWKHYFSYNQETGRLVWATNMPRRGTTIGRNAGFKRKDGYWGVIVNQRPYLAHRIIWEMNHGPIPSGYEIDHKDEDKGNNRLDNLRMCTRSQNQMNRGPKKTSKSGIKGVWMHDGRWVAKIRINGIVRHIGSFRTKEDAVLAYTNEALLVHGDFVHSSIKSTNTPEHGN